MNESEKRMKNNRKRKKSSLVKELYSNSGYKGQKNNCTESELTKHKHKYIHINLTVHINLCTRTQIQLFLVEVIEDQTND